MKCNYFYSNTVNEEIVKRNNRGYRKEQKEKYIKAKTSPRMNGMIHKLYTEGKLEEGPTLIIKLVHVLGEEIDEDYKSSDASTSSREWDGQVGENKVHMLIEPELPPPSQNNDTIVTIKPDSPIYSTQHHSAIINEK